MQTNWYDIILFSDDYVLNPMSETVAARTRMNMVLDDYDGLDPRTIGDTRLHDEGDYDGQINDTLDYGRFARWRRWSACDVDKKLKGCRINCDVGEATEGLNELWRRWSDVRVGEWGRAIFSKSSVASPTSQLIL